MCSDTEQQKSDNLIKIYETTLQKVYADVVRAKEILHPILTKESPYQVDEIWNILCDLETHPVIQTVGE